MINFILNNFDYAQESLRHLLVDISEKAVSSPQETVSAVDHQRVASVIQVVGDQCVEALCLHDAWNTIQELYYILGEHHVRPYTWGMIYSLLETLQRQISVHLHSEYFFHYMPANALLIREAEKNWANVFSSFKSIKPEVVAGIDCFAIGHNTASVFHMLRVAEFGLRMIAMERGITQVRKHKTLEYAMWGKY